MPRKRWRLRRGRAGLGASPQMERPLAVSGATSSCPHRHDVAVYALGALVGPERAALREHLDTCEQCQRELRELAGLPGLLARVAEPPLDNGHGAHRRGE